MSKTRFAKDYNIEKWNDIFEISSSSPSGIVWKISGNNKRKGSPVGWKTELGYWKCEYMDKSVLLHRVVYFLHHGHLDNTKVVDHIDRNPSNNNVNNLRLITYEENARNRSKSASNVSGFTGIYERHSFVATWSQGGKPLSKEFSVFEFGDKARLMAEEFRTNKIKELNDLDFNYSKTHGL